MDVIPTGSALGAEITGIDLSQDVSDADRDFIFNAYIDNSVLLFRGQSLSFEDLLRLREVFGPAGLTANQLLGLGRKDYYPDEVPDDITIISNIIDEDGTPRGALGDGEAFWHTDSSFTEVPISASLLHAIEVTDHGGETAFLNMYQAYDDMPDDLAAEIEGRYANHSKVHNSNGDEAPGICGRDRPVESAGRETPDGADPSRVGPEMPLSRPPPQLLHLRSPARRKRRTARPGLGAYLPRQVCLGA